jgi:hypothetical protein
MRGIIEARLGDAVGLNRKVILERDDPRRLSATIATTQIVNTPSPTLFEMLLCFGLISHQL